MNEPLWVLLLKAFGGPLVSGLVAAGITYWLSRRSFIGERWWDRKADAYGDIIGSLVAMELLLDSWIETLRRSGGRVGARKEVFSEYRRLFEGKVERAAAEGDYVISPKASGVLAELVKALKRVVAPGLDPSGPRGSSLLLDDLEWRRSEIESCLEVIRDEAKSDLGVR